MANLATLSLPYGSTEVQVDVPCEGLLAVLEPPQGEWAVDEREAVRTALAEPIGTPRLLDLAQGKRRIVIVVSDVTRPCPTARILPEVLAELRRGGVRDERITIVVGIGTHRPATIDEQLHLVGEATHARVRCLNPDPMDMVPLGETSRGTPVEIFRPVVEADLVITIGDVQFHYYAGYGGGAKAIVPGVASRATVYANHAWMTRPEAVAGRIGGNPVREDLEEAAAMAGVDFIVNVLLDNEKRIVYAVSGDYRAAHRRACEVLDQRNRTQIPRAGDIVLVSSGGFPKDINLYQAQKALINAVHAVRDGGVLVWLAECREGVGHPVWENWMTSGATPGEWIARLEREFVFGAHKAAYMGKIMARAKVVLISSLPDTLVRSGHMQPAKDVRSGLGLAYALLGSDSSLIAMPHGGAVFPLVVE